MLRLVGLRETNNGVVNNYYITGLGPLIELQFYLTNDPYFECIFTPIKFYWIDCGDNTVAYKDSINAPNNQIKLGLAADVYDIDYDYNV